MSYVNTRDEIGIQATLDGLISGSLTSIVEDGVTAIGYQVQQYSNNLQRITFPNLKTIGNGAFSYCGLTKVDETDLPSIENLNDSFQYCTKLEYFKIKPPGNFYIGGTEFYGCNSLKAQIIDSNIQPTLTTGSNFAFLSQTLISLGLGAIYVPSEMVDIYKNLPQFKKFNIFPISSYPVTDFGTITDSWSDILESESDGTYLSKYSIGDTKSISIGPYSALMEIVDFDKDDLSDGSGKAHITWLSKYIVFYSAFNTETPSNSYDYENSLIRSTIAELYDSLDANLKSAIKNVQKWFYNQYNKTEKTVVDKQFIPSARELNILTVAGDTKGCIYQRFSNDASRVKGSVTQVSDAWFTRSMYFNTNYPIIYVTSSGKYSYDIYRNKHGVVIGFCT